MARQYNLAEILARASSLTRFILKTATPGNTTTSGTTAIGASTVTVGSATNFIAAETAFLIGSLATELVTLGTPATSMPLAVPNVFAHAAGAALKSAAGADVGHLDESGVTLTGTGNLVRVNAATSRVPIASYISSGQLGGSFNLRTLSIENVLLAFGIPESTVIGSGVAATPYAAGITGSNIGTQGTMALRFAGVMADGLTNFQVDFCGVVISPNINSQLGGQNPATLGVNFDATSVIPRLWT